MILNIENLGAIKQAKLDLDSNLMLFCGKNSTGKTYASYILQAFLEDYGFPNHACIDVFVKELSETGTFKIRKEYIADWLATNCKNVVSQIGNIFGISEATSTKLFSKLSLSVDYSDDDYQKTIEMEIDSMMKDGSLNWHIRKDAGSDTVRIDTNSDFSILSSSSSFRIHSLLCNLLKELAFRNRSDVRMLTVERNSIYTFKTELSLSRNELIDRIQQAGSKSEFDIIDIINTSSRRYPLAVRSSLRIANDLDNVQKYDSNYSLVADVIERDLLHGEVSMTKNGDVEFHVASTPKTKKLPFHLSSSIVKTMASLVIYLRHIAREGDTLIIDEPEMNFHPDVQVILARIFAILSNKGLKIVISTHSDYIVRELNNLIMAGAIRSRNIQTDINDYYSEDILLNNNNVKVLFFEQSKKNVVTVKSLPIEETGFAISTIDDTIDKQNTIAEMLYAELINS